MSGVSGVGVGADRKAHSHEVGHEVAGAEHERDGGEHGQRGHGALSAQRGGGALGPLARAAPRAPHRAQRRLVQQLLRRTDVCQLQ